MTYRRMELSLETVMVHHYMCDGVWRVSDVEENGTVS